MRGRILTKSDVTSRETMVFLPDQSLKKLVESAGVAADCRQKFAKHLETAVRSHKLYFLSIIQEAPPNIIRTLKRGRKHAGDLHSYLGRIPPSIRQILCGGGIETLLCEMVDNADKQIAQLGTGRGRIPHNRQRLQLTEQLLCLFRQYATSDGLSTAALNARGRRWVADVLRAAKITAPNEKKDPKRFLGPASQQISQGRRRNSTKSRSNKSE